MHYGPPPEAPSGSTTPGSEFSQSRRLSEPLDNAFSSSGRAGPWGGDGYLYPESDDVEALPSTSFGDEDEDVEMRRSGHRRSRSYNNIAEWDRGRRRESREGGTGANDSMFHFTTSQLDPAGSQSLRHSRGFTSSSSNPNRNSHFAVPPSAATLSARAFRNSHRQSRDVTGRASTGGDEDFIPLDTEASTHAQSPQRASMGPEDELFAGESLALYAFEPENPNELRLHEGQIILVSYRHGQGWLVAEDPATGEQGLVPEEYVRLVRDIEGWDAERGTFIDSGGDLDLEENQELADETTQSDLSTPQQAPNNDEHETTQSTLPSSQHAPHSDGENTDSGNSSDAITERPNRAMLAEPPDVDHEEGLQMKDVSASPQRIKGVESNVEKQDDERRQDSGHAEK